MILLLVVYFGFLKKKLQSKAELWPFRTSPDLPSSVDTEKPCPQIRNVSPPMPQRQGDQQMLTNDILKLKRHTR